VEFFGLLDHNVMTTVNHRYICHCLELWPDAKKIDFLIDMFSETGEAWVLAAMMRLGAEQITMVAVAGEYLPEDGLVGKTAPYTRLRAVGEGLCSVLAVRNRVMSLPTAHTVLRVRARREQR